MNSVIDRLLRRKWTDSFIAKAIGAHREAYFSYAVDENIRARAASGGVVTAILGRLLRDGQVDGALVVRSFVSEGVVQSEFFIATTIDELASAQGSKYMPVYFRDAVLLIRQFSGRLAVVLLPCDARALSRLRSDDADIDRKIAFVITLFCGHNSERALTDGIIRRHQRGHGELRGFRHRVGHWRGKMQMEFADGTKINRPFQEFSDYQNLFLFAERKCHACFDHTGYYGDLAAGDIWTAHMKSTPIKHTALITRTPRASQFVEQSLKDGIICGYRVGIRDVCDGQTRGLPFHYNVSARSRVSRRFGMRLKNLTDTEVRWNHVAVAFMVLLNERLTRSPAAHRIWLRVPRPLLRGYLVLLKGLESL